LTLAVILHFPTACAATVDRSAGAVEIVRGIEATAVAVDRRLVSGGAGELPVTAMTVGPGMRIAGSIPPVPPIDFLEDPSIF
jgi:hypothetical protein